MEEARKPVSGVDRRSFMKSAAGVTAASLAAAPAINRNILGANDSLRVAVLGVNGRGWAHVTGLQDLDGVEVVTLCDPDQEVLDRRGAEFQKQYGRGVYLEQDLRKVYDDKNINAVAIATPNHWHALATIWACQAGKDVYVEKPVCHDIWEGRQLVAAVEATSAEAAVIGKKKPGSSARFAPGGNQVVWGQSGIGPHSREERHFIPSIEPYMRVLDDFAKRVSEG